MTTLLDAISTTYTGVVSLTTTVSPATAAIAVQFFQNDFNVAAGGTTRVQVVVGTLATLPTGSYDIQINGGTAAGPATLTINVAPPSLFSQGSIQFSSTDGSKPAIAIQALDFYFGADNAGVVSVRATVPTASTAPADGKLTSAPNENLRTQMLDAFGGILNLSGGWQPKTRNGFDVDIRAAVKLVEVPQDVTSSPKDGYTQSPFVAASVNVKQLLQGTSTEGHKATLVLAGSYFFNAVPDSTIAARFTTPLDRVSHAINASVTLAVPDLHFYIVGQYRWSSDKQIGHQFVFSLNPTK